MPVPRPSAHVTRNKIRSSVAFQAAPVADAIRLKTTRAYTGGYRYAGYAAKAVSMILCYRIEGLYSDYLIQSFDNRVHFLGRCLTEFLPQSFDRKSSDVTDLDPGLFWQSSTG